MISGKNILITGAVCFFLILISTTELSAEIPNIYWNSGHLSLTGKITDNSKATLTIEGPGLFLRSMKSNFGVSLTPINYGIDNSELDTEQIFSEISFFWSPLNLTEVSRLGLVSSIETFYSPEFYFDFRLGAEFVFSSTSFFNGNKLFPVFDIIDLGIDYSVTRRTINCHIGIDLLMVGYAVLISLQDEAQEKNDQFNTGMP